MWLEDRQQITEALVRNERTICNVQKQNVCECSCLTTADIILMDLNCITVWVSSFFVFFHNATWLMGT